MKIQKVINNNIVSCLDENGQETIVMGRGLGFGARPGQRVDSAQAEKVFRMDTHTDTLRLQDLLASLPEDQIHLVSQVIEYANQSLNKPLSKSLYLTLTDHLSFAISRARSGMLFQNPMLSEIRVFYPREFSIGQYALEKIRQDLGVSFPADEAANIALHLVNAEYDTSISETMRLTRTLHDILELFRQMPDLQVDETSPFYDEMIVNLKFLAMRVFSGAPLPETETEFTDSVRRIYPKEFRCAEVIAHYLHQQTGTEIPDGECAYLAALIHRINRSDN